MHQGFSTTPKSASWLGEKGRYLKIINHIVTRRGPGDRSIDLSDTLINPKLLITAPLAPPFAFCLLARLPCHCHCPRFTMLRVNNDGTRIFTTTTTTTSNYSFNRSKVIRTCLKLYKSFILPIVKYFAFIWNRLCRRRGFPVSARPEVGTINHSPKPVARGRKSPCIDSRNPTTLK